ncbi:hypothetical protein HXX76_004244 [Chlamydomonas incerta]|uniref:RBR-type E3 ubiquitin transferase n=1 Tax=Chlamydomonas incerta TaxID=51695 RepID=A0A835T9U7_CHLIN|nr:hypothetical protein HXX76_004244 [Chlamydomonas incerta]|eukprot:KAG2440131.1 hypothetical protein HXX76_004244 [Chlamydomonas incerta]
MGDLSTLTIAGHDGETCALAVDSVLDRDLTEQQWRTVESDYCSRLLAGHAEPVTLRQVTDAFARLIRLNRCLLLLRGAAAQAPAPATPASGGPVSAGQGGAVPSAATGAGVPALTQMPRVIDAALREQLLQALTRPAFNDGQFLEWLDRVAPWDEGAAVAVASSGSLQQLLGPQLLDAAAARPQALAGPAEKHPLPADQDSIKQQRQAVSQSAVGQSAAGRESEDQKSEGRKAGLGVRPPNNLATAVACPASPPAAPVPQRGGAHAPPLTPPGAAAAPLPPMGATGALPASHGLATTYGTGCMSPQQEAAGSRRRPLSPPLIRVMPAKGSGDQQQRGVKAAAAGCEQLETGLGAAAIPSRQQQQQPVIIAAAGVPSSHVSEQKQLTGRGRASDARQEEGHQSLWEYLPGTPEMPPSLRARPPVGGAAPPVAAVAAAAAERQALLTPAEIEVAYIRRLYTFLLARADGVEVGDFFRLSIGVPNAVLCGRRVTDILQPYADAGVLELRGSSEGAKYMVVRAVAGQRAEAALQQACERLLKQVRVASQQTLLVDVPTGAGCGDVKACRDLAGPGWPEKEQELQEQQDALLAQRLALAWAGAADNDVEMVKEVAAVDEDPDILMVAEQLATVRDMQSQLVVEQLRQAAAADAVAAQQSAAVARDLAEQDRAHARIAQHDSAFARRLASVDEYTWRDVGDEIQEPIEVDPPRKRACRDGPAGVERSAPPGAAGSSAGGAAGRTASGGAAGGAAGPSSAPGRTPSSRTTARSSAAQPSGAAGPSSAAAAAAASRRNDGPFGSGGSGSGGAAGPSRAAAAGGAAAAAPAAAAALRGPTTECLSCFDRYPPDQVTCAGADGASSSSGVAGCGHFFCRGCLTAFVRGVVGDRKFPVPCPMGGGGAGAAGGCKQQLSRDAARHALRGHAKDLQAFDMLEAESGIEENLRIYCPHKSCSVLLIRPEEQDIPADHPMSCPACSRAFCVRCRIPGWHKGYTCTQFQALPAHMRSAEDAAMLVLSAQHRWRQCPQCQLMVERSEGCNHMKCRCACDFCYACGKKYKSDKPTDDNVHGTPACECKLFDVPEEEEAEGGAAAGGAAGGAAGVEDEEPVRPVPWRGGRMVSRRRCRFSDSIHDCPHRFKCWFRHQEDGAF